MAFLLPENKSAIKIYGITLDAGLFEDIQFFSWLILVKVYLLIFLLVWFFTCKNWWRFAILVPLVIELIKFISLLNEKATSFDEIDYIYSLPITIPIILILLVISNKLIKNVYYIKLDDEINQLFNELESDYIINNLETEFKKLKKERTNLNKIEYLKI